MKLHRRAVLWNAGLLLCTRARLQATGTDTSDDEKTRADAALATARKDADEYTFHFDRPGAVPLRRYPEPVLRWSNPDVGSIHGAVFVWTNHGRPEAIVSLYQWFHPWTHRSHEFQSLAVEPLVVERAGGSVWTPRRAGVTFETVPESPEPGATASIRLRQMHALASDFTATERPRATADDPAPKEFALRRLSKPIYRYEGTQGDLIDGALFAFVRGTDPELILLIEAGRVDDHPRWRFALARLNSTQFRSQYKGREVFNAPELPWGVVHDLREPYFTVQFR